MSSKRGDVGMHWSAFVGSLVALALAWIFFTGLFCSDDTRYLAGIQKIVGGQVVDLSSIAERRLVFLLPGALVYWLADGLNDAAVAAYTPFYVAMPLLAWWAARSFGPGCAVLSAVLVALSPLLYNGSGVLLPDLISAFLALVVMVMTMSVLDAGPAERGAWARARLFGLGVMMMLSVSVKESNAVFAVLPPILITISTLMRGRLPTLFWIGGWVLAGGIAAACVDAVLHRAFAGQWHMSIMNRASDHGFMSYTEVQGLYPLERFSFLASIFDSWSLLLFSLAIASILVLAILSLMGRNRLLVREWGVPAVFFSWTMVYFTIGTSSFTQYVPPVMQARYFAPCAAPAAMVIAMLLLGRRQTKYGLHACLGFLLSAWLVYGALQLYPARGTQYWARAKDSVALVLLDIKRADPRSEMVVVAGNAIDSDVNRCLRLILAGERRGQGSWTTLDEPAPDVPFFVVVMGASIDRLLASPSPVGKALRSRLQAGDWRLGMIGYYYADDMAGRSVWWKPRQAAVKREFLVKRREFHEQSTPAGQIPRMKREMHAELYVVYPGDGRDGWWNE